MSVEYRILGPLEVLVDGKQVKVSAPKQRALLAMLLVENGHYVSRDRLIDELWGDDAPSDALNTLRYTISKLRSALKEAVGEDPIETGTKAYRFGADPDSIDAARFERIRIEAQKLRQTQPTQASALLREALSLFRGAPLAEFAYEPFAVEPVRHLEDSRDGAREARIAIEIDLGHHADVLSEIAALVAEHPLNEALRGQLMVALYRSGRQADALREYQDLRARIGEELGIEPTDELRVLEERILLHSLPSPRERLALPDSLVRETDSPLFGRDNELEVLRSQIERVFRGRKAFCLISGEAGVGKSRLASEIAQRAFDVGALILHGRCDREIQPAWRPLSEMVGYVLRNATRPKEFFVGSPEDLRRLSPELNAVLAPADTPPSADPATEQFRMLEAIVIWLSTLAKDQPIVIVIDDLHWADVDTLSAIRYIAQSPTPMPVMIIATARKERADQTTAFRKLAPGLFLDDRAMRIELDGLDEESVMELVSALSTPIQDELGRRFCRMIRDQTDGNPFFLREVVRQLKDQSDGADEPFWLTLRTAADLAVPDTVEAAITERLSRLGEEGAEIIRMAAVAGSEFDFGVVVRATGRSAGQVGAALKDAHESSLIRPVPSERKRYRFAHALVRDAIRAGVSGYDLWAAHGSIGQAMDREYGRSMRVPYGEMSFHFAEAIDADTNASHRYAERAIDYALQGAERARKAMRASEAAALYRRAVTVMERSDGDAETRCKIMLRMGRAERRAGDASGARRTLLAVCELAAHEGSAELLIDAALSNSRGIFSTVGSVDRERVRWIWEAIEASEGPEPEMQAKHSMLLGQLSTELMYGEEWAEGYERAQRALQIAEGLHAAAPNDQTRRVLLRILNDTHGLIWRPDMLRERAEIIKRIDELAEKLEGDEWRWPAASFGAQLASEQGDNDGAAALTSRMLRYAEELKQPTLMQWARLRQGIASVIAGDLQGAEQAEESYRVAIAAGHEDAAIFALGQRWMIRYHQDRLNELAAELAGMQQALPGLPVLSAGLAALYAETDRPDEARSAMGLLPESALTRVDQDYLTVLSVTSITASYLRDEPLSKQLLDQLAHYRDQFVDAYTSYHGSVAHFMGLSADCLGRYGEADDHFAYAVAAHRDRNMPPYLARSLVEWSRSLAVRDPELASERAYEALQIADHYQLAAVQRRASDLLGSLS